MGDLPVAVITPGVAGPEVYYVYADHLQAPRVLTRASDSEKVWRWDYADPFGLSQPDENPRGLGKFTYNLRFPGQMFDKETNNHYNFFRDYDPQTGRYIQSDPLGLLGGNSTYVYVSTNPVMKFDPTGLIEWKGGMAGYALTPPITPGGMLGRGIYFFSLTSACVRGQQWRVTVRANASVAAFGFPASITGSALNFQDGLDYINPYVFNGRFSFASLGVAVGIGYSLYNQMALGNALSSGGGLYGGVDYYGSFGSGYSTVTSAVQIECECAK